MTVTMTVTLVLSDDKIVQVPNTIVSTSKVITSCLEDTESDNVTITVPVVYTTVCNYYLDVLNDKPIIINDVDTLLICFKMESFFADDKFLKQLICMSYLLWKDFYPHINELPNARTVYLHTPYEFLPDAHIKTSTFFNEWIHLNQDREITVNGDGAYQTKVQYITERFQTLMEVNSYHTVSEQHGTYSYYQLRDIWYTDNTGQLKQVKSQNRFKSKSSRVGKRALFTNRDGLQQGWYDNGQIKYQENYIEGKKHGLQQGWNKNNNGHNSKLKYQANINSKTGSILLEKWHTNDSNQNDGNQKDSSQKDSSQNRQLMIRNNYVDDNQTTIPPGLNCVAVKTELYRDSMDTCIYGIRHGLQESWYSNGKLKSQDNYIYGSLDGVQKEWSKDGQLVYKELYNMDKFVQNLPLLE